jgi:isopenicillin-N N-acyltransferase-like protein
MPDEIPVLELSSEPYEMGREHGRRAQNRVRHNLSVYFRRFEKEANLTRHEALRRSEQYLAVIRGANPAYAKAMEGLSEGANCNLLEITALNVRYELIYSEFTRMGLELVGKALPRPYGCSGFAAMPEVTKDGHLLLGQNWDWVPGIQSLFLKIRDEDGISILCFTEAGIVGGKIGLNSAGIGLTINGMVSQLDDWSRLGKPFHVRCWEVLNSRTLEEAANVVREDPRACSANFILAQATEQGATDALDLEAAPSGILTLKPQDGLLTHTNHFSNSTALGVTEPLEEERKGSVCRRDRLGQLLRETRMKNSKLSLADLQAILRDHNSIPESICRHAGNQLPEEKRYQTLVSIIMDLHAQRLWHAAGPPCMNDYLSLSMN